MRSGADNQERILETSLVQNGGLLKHGDTICGQEEMLLWVVRSHLLYSCKVGRGLGMVSVSKEFWKQGF